MATIEVDPSRLATQAQRLAGAALSVDALTLSVRVCEPSTGDAGSEAALAGLLRTLDTAVYELASVAAEVAATLGDVAVAYATADGQDR